MKIGMDLRELQQKLEKFRDSIPRRTSFALNKALFDARDHVIKRTYPRAFMVRQKQFARFAFRVVQARAPKLEGHLLDAQSKDYFVRHAAGGIKTPKGTYLAIPKDVRRTGKGMIPKAQRPRQALNRADTFIMNSRKTGQPMIVQRVGRGAGGLRILYYLEPRARIPKSFDFYEDGEMVVTKTFPGHWDREIAEGMRHTFKGTIGAKFTGV